MEGGLMNQSEQINELATALAKCQSEMTHALKDSENPFHKSKYANLASVWEAVRAPMTKNGLCVVQSMEIIGEQVILISTLMHSSGQWIKSTIPVINAQKTSQGQGSGITYARRYALAALVGCVQDDDDGEAAMPKDRDFKAKKAPAPDDSPVIDYDKRKVLHNLSDQCDKSYMATLYSYIESQGVKGFDKITEKLYPRILKGMTQNAQANRDKNV
jgi:hypothetical protein